MIIWIGFSQAFGINKRTRIGEHFISQVRLGKQHTTYNDSEFYLQDVKKIDKRNRNLKKKIANAPTDNFHVVEWLLRIENGNGSHMGNFVSNGSTVSTWDTPCLAVVTFQEFTAQHQLFILGLWYLNSKVDGSRYDAISSLYSCSYTKMSAKSRNLEQKRSFGITHTEANHEQWIRKKVLLHYWEPFFSLFMSFPLFLNG